MRDVLATVDGRAAGARRMRRALDTVLPVALPAAVLLVALRGGASGPPREEPAPSPERAVDEEADAPEPAPGAGWKEADPERRIVFPRDHGPHPAYRIEWWYWTGNLRAANGRELGFQLTFFRSGLAREPATRSRWAVRDLHLAHFAVSDLDAGRFHPFERLARAGPGLAGNRFDPESGRFRSWIRDWEAVIDGDTHRLEARDDGVALSLVLEALRPPVLHGEDGYSRKGPSAGNASHYYSIPRLRARGTVELPGGDAPLRVEGLAWMDHEFGSTFLEESQTGWDWLSLQLDDGRDLMAFRLRGRPGSGESPRSGTLVQPDGRVVRLEAGDLALEPLPGPLWRSPRTGGEYPLAFRVQVPRAGIDLEVRAVFPAQELETPRSTGITYWEGAVRARGRSNGQPVEGKGYLELTGYADRGPGRAFRSGEDER